MFKHVFGGIQSDFTWCDADAVVRSLFDQLANRLAMFFTELHKTHTVPKIHRQELSHCADSVPLLQSGLKALLPLLRNTTMSSSALGLPMSRAGTLDEALFRGINIAIPSNSHEARKAGDMILIELRKCFEV